MNEVHSLDDLLGPERDSLAKRKLLVVDDKPEVIEGIRTSRLSHAYEIVPARNGAEALERLESDGEIGVVLLDMLMPVMGGEQFLKELRGNPERYGRYVRVIVYTAFAGRGVEQAAVLSEYGPLRFLTKATDPAVIGAEVRNAYTEFDTTRRVTTELARLHLALLERERDLADERRMSALRGLTGQLAHDINNAAQAVEGTLRDARRTLSATAIVERAQEDAGLRRYLRSLYDTLVRSETGIRRIAEAVARGRQTVSADRFAPERCDLNAELATYAFRAEVDVRLELDPTLEPFLFDPVLLWRAVINAVDNAQRAVQKKPEAIREVVVATRCLDDYVEITIRDGGIGLSEVDLAKLADNTHWTTKQGGEGVAGFGVAIIRTVVQAHGGTLDFTSRFREGTTCRIRLPHQKSQ